MSNNGGQRPRALTNLRLDRVDLVGKGANENAHIMLFKSAVADTTETAAIISDSPSEETILSTENAVTDEVETVEAVTETVTEAAAEPVVAKADEPVAVTKAEHEAVAKALETAQAEIAKMRDDAELAKFVSIAKADLGSLPEKPETIGLLLKKAHGALDEAEYLTLTRLLKAANAQTDTSALFKQFADANDGEAESVEDVITAKAEELRKTDSKLTIEQAKTKVMQSNPELRKSYSATGR